MTSATCCQCCISATAGVWAPTTPRTFRPRTQRVAYVMPAKAMAWTIVDLLSDDASQARQVLHGFQPKLTRDTYLAHMRSLARTERYP